MTPEEMVSRLLYRDGLMLVIDKPAGFAVHRGPQQRRRAGKPAKIISTPCASACRAPPALAHRLDRDTSGCLVLGRHRKALAQLGKLFKQRRDRQDLLGRGRRRAGRRRGRRSSCRSAGSTTTRGWWMKHDPNGQPAVTKWKVMGRADR